ncbi:hypothetical protein [Leptolyngbya sp. NIES-2104]|uniref:hypothetical protein n=1 Tax=Leptolyngbya sp. NIES-2104 TaxID=1552121 RepID=UPI0006EC4D07|nr:hypothetical protein [Leptolyngbya sp. NIES-2104]GAP97293.1 alpha-mannosidase [Leptolyngbya sp. NIES-2104]
MGYSKQIAIWGIGLSMLVAIPAIAQSDNLRSLTLDNQTSSGMMMGSTGGRTSLPAVVSNNDRQNQRCLGFGDPSPDHTLVLKRPFSSVSLRVDSGGGDTTLLISGPGGVRCADSGESGGDVRVQQDGWEAGTYQIWVGTVTPNVNRDYRLIVRGK